MLEDVTRIRTLPPHDLVMAAYSLGEIAEPLAARLWQAARVALVAIEPGTPRGYALILKVREELLEAGACMVAPCPAATPCPLAAPDWCHFAARVERSSIHRRIKDAELGYEDEKFSYIAVAREAGGPGRLAHHPAPAAAARTDRAGNLRAGRRANGARAAERPRGLPRRPQG